MKLADIAAALEGTVEGDATIEIDALEPLDQAGAGHLSFLSNPRYASQLPTTRASAVILGPGVTGPGCAVLRVADAYLAFAKALTLFARPVLPREGIDRGAHVAEDATIGPGARIGPGAVVGSGARIGARAVLHPGVVVYPDVVIGDDFTAHANCVIRERVRIGDRVLLGPGVVIGGDGFGFVPLPGGGVWKMAQVGTVEIGDDVEIGANSTVDRATIGRTVLERNVKLDNLVMVAHGCRIEEAALLAGQTGLAGSTIVGARAQLGGQVGSAGHLRVGADARVAAQTGLSKGIPDGASVAGYPSMEIGLWRRAIAATRHLPELFRRVKRLEDRVGTRDP
jgi:UDP-3-O-[3-hydroxymyristoyl] glucosamine N-acyltransferase